MMIEGLREMMDEVTKSAYWHHIRQRDAVTEAFMEWSGSQIEHLHWMYLNMEYTELHTSQPVPYYLLFISPKLGVTLSDARQNPYNLAIKKSYRLVFLPERQNADRYFQEVLNPVHPDGFYDLAAKKLEALKSAPKED